MLQLHLTTFTFLTVLSGITYAATPMSQIEFQELIAGNTMVGEWAGQPYKQFFDINHTTIYQEENRPPTQGTWRINEQGQYCSVWPPNPQEACYDVTREGNNLLWHSDENVYPATVVEGNQM